MFNRLSADELLDAASDAFRGDRATARAVLSGVRARAGERARSDITTVPAGPSIRSRRTPAPLPVPAPPPPRPVTARVDGYTAIVSLQPPPARHSDLEAVRRAVAANDRAAFDELAHHRTVVERLERDNAALSARIDAIEKRTDAALMGVVEGVGQFKREMRRVPPAPDLSAIQQEVRLQQIQGLVASVQSAAYGEPGSVFSKNNLMLVGNQLAWMLAAPALQRMGFVNGSQAQLLAAVAPLGSLITGGLTLGRRQHVRFITGVTTFTGTSSTAIESLKHRIASGAWPAFARRTDVPVSVTTISGEQFRGVAAVRNGVLVLRSLPDGRSLTGRVAWMIDTGESGG